MPEARPIEIYEAPRFPPGCRVRSTKQVRNDGTVPGTEIGAVVVGKGEVGYVRDVGVFLQQYYVYAVEFLDRQAIVGMRAHELQADGAVDMAP
ncbi:MAG: nitrogen fixation protein NifZ [Pseudomonadota bacterium]